MTTEEKISCRRCVLCHTALTPADAASCVDDVSVCIRCCDAGAPDMEDDTESVLDALLQTALDIAEDASDAQTASYRAGWAAGALEVAALIKREYERVKKSP